MRSRAKRKISWAGQDVGRCTRSYLDDAGGDFDEAQAQGVELSAPPHRARRHRVAQAPHQPVGAGVQEQPKLIGGGLSAGGAIRARCVLKDLMWFSAWPRRQIDILVERPRVAFAQIGDDETRIGPLRADFDPGDDPLDPAPALGAVEEFLAAADLAVARRGLERAFVLASSPSTCRRNVGVGATPRM